MRGVYQSNEDISVVGDSSEEMVRAGARRMPEATLVLNLVLFSGPCAVRGTGWHPGVAVLLLQEPAACPDGISRARPVHSADQAKEHPALADGRGPDHPSGRGILLFTGIGYTKEP